MVREHKNNKRLVDTILLARDPIVTSRIPTDVISKNRVVLEAIWAVVAADAACLVDMATTAGCPAASFITAMTGGRLLVAKEDTCNTEEDV